MFTRSQKPYLTLFRLSHITFPQFGTQAQSNHYEALGLQKGATSDEVKKAFQKLSKKYHPDVSTDKDAAEKFKKINTAYTVLKDKKSKSDYDQQTGGYDTQAHKTYKYSQKAPENTEEAQEEVFRRKSYVWGRKSQEELLYESIFKKTYKEDPMFYYKEENKLLRHKYDFEAAALREKLRKERDEARGYSEEQSKSNTDTDGETEDFYQDRKNWDNFNKERDQSDENQGEGSKQWSEEMREKYQEKKYDAKYMKKLAIRCGVVGAVALFLLLRERKQSKMNFEEAGKPLGTIELEQMRLNHMLNQEEKKEKGIAKYMETLALMKKYPRRNPNVTSMLVDYTIWNDLKVYSVPWQHFHSLESEAFKHTDEFEKDRVFNVRINAMLTLALECERVFKHIYVKIDDVMDNLNKTGHYEPPGVFFRYFGYIYVKIRRKPIEVDNLLHSIQNGEQVISIFDLYFRYTTPILLANDEYYEIPLNYMTYIKDTTTKQGVDWIGNAHINPRPIEDKIVHKNDKNIFMWRGPPGVKGAHERYMKTWGQHYDTFKKLP